MVSERVPTVKNLLDIDEQIRSNEKYLEFYYANYQKTQGKITILTLIYSVISIYIIQIIKYPFESTQESAFIFFSIFLLIFIIFLGISIFNTYRLLHPEEVAYMNFPKFFYSDIKREYEEALNTTEEALINEYVKYTYLKELEKAIETNSKLYETKSRFYYLAFRNGLASLILYLICSGFVIFKEENGNEVTKIKIANFKEIIDYSDSLNIDSNKLLNMSESNNGKDSRQTQRPKVDPKKVIITKPKMIRENFSRTDSLSNNKKSKQASSKKQGG